MLTMLSLLMMLSLFATAQAGPMIWNGLFNDYSSVADFDKWSFSNQIGSYQWYIHGSSPTASYLAFSPSYKNPAEKNETQGLKLTIDGTSIWNNDGMDRTELIPQTHTGQNIVSGHMYYHFSFQTSTVNPPNANTEHNIAWFETGFTMISYGYVSTKADNLLRWTIQGVNIWNTTLVPGTWYNFAYDIDFTASTVGLWTSTNSNLLVQVMTNQPASVSSTGADWHSPGVLRMPGNPPITTAEDWYWSGVYIEQAPITTAIGGEIPSSVSSVGGGATSSTTTTATTKTVPSTTSTLTSTTSSTSAAPSSSPTGGTVQKYGQCGGTGYTGPTTCVSGTTCVAVSPPYYYQCQ